MQPQPFLNTDFDTHFIPTEPEPAEAATSIGADEPPRIPRRSSWNPATAFLVVCAVVGVLWVLF